MPAGGLAPVGAKPFVDSDDRQKHSAAHKG